MTREELESKSVWISRFGEPGNAIASAYSSSRDNYDTACWYKDAAYLLHRNRGDGRLKVAEPLIVQSAAIPATKSPPTRRINLHPDKELNWIIRQGVRRASSDVLSRSKFRDRLEVLVDWKIEADTGDDLVRTVQHSDAARALR